MGERNDPHAGQPVLQAGSKVEAARRVVILLHGRGASAEDILGLATELRAPDVAYLAPQASGHAWYPNSFLAPIEDNEPWLSSALRRIASILAGIDSRGQSAGNVVLMGFSQGACLALEFAARNARRYAAVVAFSGGLIGPPETPRDYAGGFDGTPAFLGCSDSDPHVPLARVRESTAVLQRMGAAVDERIYPRMAHTINVDELRAVDAILAG